MAGKDEPSRLQTESIEQRIGQAIIDGILRPAEVRAAAKTGPVLNYDQGNGITPRQAGAITRRVAVTTTKP